MKKTIPLILIAAALGLFLAFTPLKFSVVKWAYERVLSAVAHQEVSIGAIEAYPLRRAVFEDMDISVGKKAGLNISRAQLDYNLASLLLLKVLLTLRGEGLTLYNKIGSEGLKVRHMAFREVEASLVLKPGEVVINSVDCVGDDAKAQGSGFIKEHEMNMAFNVKLNRMVPGVGKLFKLVGADEAIPSFNFTAVVTGDPKDPSFDISSDIFKLKFDKQ